MCVCVRNYSVVPPGGHHAESPVLQFLACMFFIIILQYFILSLLKNSSNINNHVIVQETFSSLPFTRLLCHYYSKARLYWNAVKRNALKRLSG